MKTYIVTVFGKPGSRVIEAETYEVEGAFVHFVITEAGKKTKIASFNSGAVEGIVEKREIVSRDVDR
jgi:hypothetical protein